MRTTDVSGLRLHGARSAHGPPSRFAPRKCAPTYPFVMLLAPVRYSDFTARHTHVRASASYVKSLDAKSGNDFLAVPDLCAIELHAPRAVHVHLTALVFPRHAE